MNAQAKSQYILPVLRSSVDMHSTGLGPLEGAGNMWCLASDSFMSRQGGRRNHMKHFMMLDSVVLEAEE